MYMYVYIMHTLLIRYLATIFQSGYILNMGETCVDDYTYIADYTCLCCDDVEPKYLESKKH